MNLLKQVKKQLLIRGFKNDTLINNRGLIGATIDEVILMTFKNNADLPIVSGSFSIVVWNKIENRPATNDEINFLINGDDDDGQLFLSWNKLIATEEDKGQVYLHIDSGEEDNYEIRYVSNAIQRNFTSTSIEVENMAVDIDQFIKQHALAKPMTYSRKLRQYLADKLNEYIL